MSQTPHGNPGYPAPENTQAKHVANQPGFSPEPQVAPDAEEKLKRSQIVLLATAGAYLLAQVLNYVLTPDVIDVMGEPVPTSQNPVTTTVSTVFGVFLFALVYRLIAKHKKAGRVAGYVFAGFGILGAAVSAIGALTFSIAVLVLCLLWLGLAIYWIVAVSNKSVSSILR